MRFVTISVLLLFHLVSFGQSWEVQIKGEITEMNGTIPISDVLVVLLENDDTLGIIQSDDKGRFTFSTRFSENNEYAIQCLHLDKVRAQSILYHFDDSLKVTEYQVDFSFFIEQEKMYNQCAYYELNETEIIQELEPEFIKFLLDEYPNLCLKFHQSIHPSEMRKIAHDRLANFIAVLESMNCDMSRLKFSNEIFFLSEDKLSYDSRSRIEGVVSSTDGDCE